MPLPRSSLVSLEATPYYHVISRCVRKQFLCGFDRLSGRDFSYRRDWIRARIFELAAVFAIRVCAYAVMSNHFHLVVRLEPDEVTAWTDRAVAARWLKLFGGRALVRQFVAGKPLSEAQLGVVSGLIRTYRARLSDLSWFMRCLNEPIARQANAEDQVTGRFWEGRFRSQAILDEAALIATMAYVDLNPVRAGMAETPEASDYTSIQQRIFEQASGAQNGAPKDDERPISEDLAAALGKLLPFSDDSGRQSESVIPYTRSDYLALIDWTGRAMVHGKRGSIPEHLPPILERLNLDPAGYLRFIQRDKSFRFRHFIGPVNKMRQLAECFSRRFLKGQAAAARLFSPG